MSIKSRIEKLEKEAEKKIRADQDDYLFVRKLENEYGLSLTTYIGMLINQEYKCAICEKKESAKGNNGKIKRMAIDHCHETGQVRGLLCQSCNTALGAFEDSENYLRNAIEYLNLDHEKKLVEAGKVGAQLIDVPYKR